MFEAVFELVAELVINIFGELLFEGLLNRITRRGWMTFALAVTGGALGWASTAVLPRAVISPFWLRVVYVIVVPVVTAFVIDLWNERRIKRGKAPGLLSSWADAYFFSLAFSLVRLLSTL